MESSEKNTPAYICYILVSISWYAALIGAIIFAGVMIFRSAGFVATDYFVVHSLPLDTEFVQFTPGTNTENLTLDSATAKVSLTPFFEKHPGHYIGTLIFLFIYISVSLYGFYQLKALLKSTVDNNVFTKANIHRLRIIAFLVLLIDPVHWVVEIYFKTIFSRVSAANTISISLGDLELSYFMVGLLLFVLATVFERGYEMYQELKLTV